MLTLNSRTVQPYLAHKKLAPFDIAHTSPTSPVLFAAFAVPVEDFVIGADWRVKWWGEREEQALSAGIVYEHEGARGKGLATFAGSAAPAPDWDKARPRVMGKIRTGNAPLQLQLVIRTSSSHLALRDDPPLALFGLVIHPQTSPNPELASLARLEEEVGGWLQELATAAGPSQLADGAASPADESHDGRLWVSSLRPL
ncbi:hypothetical protein JCM1841_000966 [Sporobolomyces salmonicolor]